ncbi:DUF7268 family protein [Salinigranum halophilum]|jgi:hypothetical protein|uniref:DUF7268 family protein n=1 Tax=Salinigranum halophilum TaxID=2565931 RepID=UPI001F1C5E94|nr:hypothetical protein [Salinigranum halophilum]
MGSSPSASSVGDDSHREPTPSLGARVRLVGSALLAGGGVGAVGVGGGAFVEGVAVAADTGFLLGTVAFGFGLLGWAGSVVAGPGLEAMQAHLDAASGWTETDSRRAMARIGAFGAGVMLAAVVVGTALGYA